MTYRHQSCYAFLPSPTSSAFSRPRRERPDGSYEIHLVKSQDPAYIPTDLEALCYRAIIDYLVPHRAIHTEVLKAVEGTRAKLAGLENRERPGSIPPN